MYAILDIETTGGNNQSDRIIEIAIVLYDGEKVEEAFTTLINPERRIPYRISNITGITNEMVAGMPKFYEVARQIVEFTQDRTLVAHNAKFDYGFLKNEFKSLGFEYKRDVLCTVALSRSLLPGQKSYNLGRLCNAIGIEAKNFHRALADAKACASLFLNLLDIAKKRAADLETAGQLSRLNPDAHLKKEQIDKLPNETGVYYFYNEWQELIYVGKSVDIRSRVLSHFANNTSTKALEMKAAISHIRYAVTGSELVALLKESEEIKRFKPIYNRAQRRSRFSVGLFGSYDENGYLQFKYERLRKGGEEPISAFATLNEAKNFLTNMVEQHTLCQRLTSLQKGKGACFHHAIHKCKGACIGKESVKDYNFRAQEVIGRLKYAGNNLLIIDQGRNQNESSLVLVENGHYLGYGYIENEFIESELAVLKKCIQNFADNKDVRQIINLYLRQGKPQRIIEF